MRKKVTAAIICVGIFTFLSSTSLAEAPTPGSIDDPVITKSYFDRNNISEEQIKQIVASAMAAKSGGNAKATNDIIATQTGTSRIEVVQLRAGQTIYAGEGTEVIVRTGKTIAVSNDENGIPDVTSGKDIVAGSAIETNHMLIFPREGRGIKPDPKSNADIYVMVKGGYLILNADGSKVQ